MRPHLEIRIFELPHDEAREAGGNCRVQVWDLGAEELIDSCVKRDIYAGYVWAGKFLADYT